MNPRRFIVLVACCAIGSAGCAHHDDSASANTPLVAPTDAALPGAAASTAPIAMESPTSATSQSVPVASPVAPLAATSAPALPASTGPSAAATPSTVAQSAATPASLASAATAAGVAPENVAAPVAVTSIAPQADVASPAPTPAATADPNLLAMSNGAFVRRWTTGVTTDGVQQLPEGYHWALAPGINKPVSIVFEMPVRSTLNTVRVHVERDARIDVAVSDDDRTYANVATLQTKAADFDATQNISGAGRFVRFNLHDWGPGTGRTFVQGLTVTGTPDRTAAANFTGYWISPDSPQAENDHAVPALAGAMPKSIPKLGTAQAAYIVSMRNGRALPFRCNSSDDVWRGTVDGNFARNGADGISVTANGNMIVGQYGGRQMLAYRAPKPPEECYEPPLGSGPTVAVFWRSSIKELPEADPKIVPGYRYEFQQFPILDPRLLARARVAIIGATCNATQNLDAEQQKALVDWISAGHTLVIRDADVCTSSNYDFLPVPFRAKAAGAGGARGSTLVIADPSTLGSFANDPKHAIDTTAYIANTDQQLGDSDLMQTQSLKWCGLLYARNRADASGWIHAYARLGRGLIIYNGFDTDDLQSKIPAAEKLSALEYSQPPAGDLPCNAQVAAPIALYPSTERKIAPGRSQTIRVPLTLDYATPLYGNALQRTFAIRESGGQRLRAHLSLDHASMKPGSRIGTDLVIDVPATLRPGTYAFAVDATSGTAKAEATITLNADIALAKQLLASKRARLYGIHFDVASDHISPQSEATIEQIAEVLRQYPSWHMSVEGHTDSDGGDAYNRTLSTARARAVVADLEHRFHIASNRLRANGYGASRPVASNDSNAGKALNRRVELART